MVAASTCHRFAAFAVSDDSSSCSERRGVGLVLEFRLVSGVSILLSGSTRGIRPSQFQNNGFPDLFGRLYSLILIAGMVSRPSIVNRASETTTACARRRVGATNSPRSNPDEMVTMEGSGVAPNNLASSPDLCLAGKSRFPVVKDEGDDGLNEVAS
ncbi:hypothetical protein F2Q70_00012277 [Brassica cretica]|uniref:Uncharacterized protein n=1 Tax=Brassica cretica TaxID=69181 RepID=A0A8S9M4M2_BRACR|nr:hypothetical protein F2Q70_00012277 [Brassica cretica]